MSVTWSERIEPKRLRSYPVYIRQFVQGFHAKHPDVKFLVRMDVPYNSNYTPPTAALPLHCTRYNRAVALVPEGELSLLPGTWVAFLGMRNRAGSLVPAVYIVHILESTEEQHRAMRLANQQSLEQDRLNLEEREEEARQRRGKLGEWEEAV